MKPRSSGVTVVALLMGIWFGMGALIGGVQVGAIAFFAPPGFLEEAFSDPQFRASLPAPFLFFMKHFLQFAVAGIILSLATSFAAFGVWRRNEWARSVMLILLLIHIALSVAGPALAMQIVLAHSTPDLPGAIGRIPHAFALIAMLPSLCFAAAYGWFFYTLTRPQIRAEFR